MKSEIEQLINNSAEIIKKTSSLSGEIQKVINEIIRCLKNGNKVILFGNGGSLDLNSSSPNELIDYR